MRVTSSMYYDSLYGANGSKLNKELFDVNKQIASGLKIQYASDDVTTFTETMRLDNELTTLNQVKNSTESGYKVSNQSDVILNEFENSMTRFRTLLVNAANDSNSDSSRDAIAAELRGLEDHLKNLSNTSINGQYLFSGSAVDVKPISDDGTYNGNDVSMNSFLGSNSQQQYNLSGADLFLGEEMLVQREVTTNVVQTLNAPSPNASSVPVESSLMSEFMGLSPDDEHYFYLRGTQSDGTAVKEQFVMNNSDTLDTLLTTIGNYYGNAGNVDLVNVSLSPSGQIVIEDKIKGSSKLDFHLVGATDFSGAGTASDFNNLAGGTTDYSTAIGTPKLYVKEFITSGLTSATGALGAEGLIYDRTEFVKDGPILSSNVPQIVKEDNSFATDSTKLHEVFSDITYDIDGNYVSGLDSKVLSLDGIDVNGAAYTASVNLFDGGSTFTINGTPYDVLNVDGTQTTAGEMSYKQLMDVINIAVTGTPSAGNFHDTAKDADLSARTYLTYDGKIQFEQTAVSNTSATMALYDSNSGDFTAGASASMVTFNSNNALTIRDPKTDFFKTINEMIVAVENHKNYPDSANGEMRNVGIENAIAMMDDLQEHVGRTHSMVGAQSNTLTNSLERTELLEISTMTLRASVIDTDLAEASLRLTQLTLNYQAMQYTVGKVSALSLVNYL